MPHVTSRGSGEYVASEEHVLSWGSYTAPGTGRLVVGCQGSHGLASHLLSADTWDRVSALNYAGFVNVAGDLSQTTTQGTFGNTTAQTRIGQLRTFGQSNARHSAKAGQVHLIGGSGGCTGAINYARANPDNVASMYLIVPLVDLQDLYENRTDVAVTQAEIDTAYGGDVTASYATHDPSAEGNQAALRDIPIRIAYSESDNYIPVSTVLAYAELVNAAGGRCETFSMGPIGHSGTGVEPGDVVRFFERYQ